MCRMRLLVLQKNEEDMVGFQVHLLALNPGNERSPPCCLSSRRIWSSPQRKLPLNSPVDIDLSYDAFGFAKGGRGHNKVSRRLLVLQKKGRDIRFGLVCLLVPRTNEVQPPGYFGLPHQESYCSSRHGVLLYVF